MGEAAARGFEGGLVTGGKQAINTTDIFLRSSVLNQANRALRAFDEIDSGKSYLPTGEVRPSQNPNVVAPDPVLIDYERGTPELRGRMREQLVNRVASNKEAQEAAMLLYRQYADEQRELRGDVPDLKTALADGGFAKWVGYTGGNAVGSSIPALVAALAGTLVGGPALAPLERLLPSSRRQSMMLLAGA
jgi:hypothetical protein